MGKRFRLAAAALCLIAALYFLLPAAAGVFHVGMIYPAAVLLLAAAALLFPDAVRRLFTSRLRKAAIAATALLCAAVVAISATCVVMGAASSRRPAEGEEVTVIVLGCHVEGSEPSVMLRGRINAAYDYLAAHPDALCIVSGGKGADEPMTEARAMYDELVKLGIDPERIWIEDRATSTWENLNFALDLIEEKTGTRPENLGIVSSEYHLFRASLFADACGVEPVLIPARTSVITQRINHFMREVAGVWHYLILGGQYE